MSEIKEDIRVALPIEWYRSTVYRGLITSLVGLILHVVLPFFGYELKISEVDLSTIVGAGMEFLGLLIAANGRNDICTPIKGTASEKTVSVTVKE